ncbi:MAG TPA: uroporphyrinogen decarboxylase family protein [Methanomassiliicoccales archaeon]|nr:uroporphyrinogen decarboxylase family protein [Methanomassiliicoccales archaeon]
MALNERQRLELILNGEEVDRPACICPMSTATLPLMRASGVRLHEMKEHPTGMAKLALAAHNIAGIESARLPLDAYVEITAFGAQSARTNVSVREIVLHTVVPNPSDADALQVPDPRHAGRVPKVLEAVRILEEEHATLPILIGIVSPLMLAMQLRGAAAATFDMVNEPELLKKLLRKCAEFDLEFMKVAFADGADHLVIDDSLSSGDFLTHEQFHEFSEPYDDEIANRCREYSFESIVHVCGNSHNLLDKMLDIDTDGISIDEDVAVDEVKKVARSKNRRVAVVGNVCPSRTLLLGDRDAVVEATKKAIDEGVDAVAPGCNLEMYTSIENLKAMVETTKNYGIYSANGRGRT